MATRCRFVVIIKTKFFTTMKMNSLTGICILDCISKLKTIEVPQSWILSNASFELMTDNNVMVRYSFVNTSNNASVTYVEQLENLEAEILKSSEDD